MRTYIFFHEYTNAGTSCKVTITASNFRLARTEFFNKFCKDHTGVKIVAVHELDEVGTLLNIYH